VYCGEEATILALSYNQENQWKGQKDTVVSCHLKYHAQKEFLKTTSSSTPNNNIDSV
ncbi:MAG: hypothetical protein ACI90V_002342, partial [Bacillariaceae sp.]|jgi:hypothetical protein